MRRLIRFFAVILLLLSSAAALQAQNLYRPELKEADLETLLRTEWYGLYLKGKKIGYFKAARARVGDEISDSFVMHMKLLSFGKKGEVNMSQDLRYAAKPPYALQGGKFEQQSGALAHQIALARGAKGFQVTEKIGQEQAVKQVNPIDYTLADALSTELWIRSGPKVATSISYLDFDMQDLKAEPQKSAILSIKTSLVEGVMVRFYEVDTESRKEKIQILSRHDEQGRLLSGNMAIFEIRLEPEEQAKNIEYSQDLFVLGMVKTDKALGPARHISELVLQADSKEAAVFENGPRQRVEDAPQGGKLLKLGKKYANEIKATPKEIEECLAETSTYRIQHPLVKELAAKAVGDAKTPEEKVKRLVLFVHNYIEPSLSSSMPQIHDLLDKKKGDCKSYALLFTNLARAAGIPARELGGLMYIGDDAKAFGGHAWNEVVLNGAWVPIDATFNQVEVDASHLSYGTDYRAAKNLLSTIGKLSFRVIEVQKTNGK